MGEMPSEKSLYRQMEAKFGADEDAFFEWLEHNKHEDYTVAIGWALMRARRYYNLDQVQIAGRTRVVDSRGRELVPPITKSFISAMLSGRSKVQPDVYERLARACDVNPIHFFIAERWMSPSDVAAFNVPERDVALPLLAKLDQIPEPQRPAARATVLAVLDTLIATTRGMEERAVAEPPSERARRTPNK